ncbi:hypothetical protein MKX03_037776, partial [Papaver bracteatum]
HNNKEDFRYSAGKKRKTTEKIATTRLKSSKLLLLPIISAFAVFPLTCSVGSVTIEGQIYMVYSVTHRYQLRKGKYEPSEKRLDVLSSGRYIVNLYLQNLLEQS